MNIPISTVFHRTIASFHVYDLLRILHRVATRHGRVSVSFFHLCIPVAIIFSLADSFSDIFAHVKLALIGLKRIEFISIDSWKYRRSEKRFLYLWKQFFDTEKKLFSFRKRRTLIKFPVFFPFSFFF